MFETLIRGSWKKIVRQSLLASLLASTIPLPAAAQLSREQKLQILQDMNRKFEEQNAERRAQSQRQYQDDEASERDSAPSQPSSWQQFNQDFNAQARSLYQRKAAEADAAASQAELARQRREIDARNQAAAEYKIRTYGRSEIAGTPVHVDPNRDDSACTGGTTWVKGVGCR